MGVSKPVGRHHASAIKRSPLAHQLALASGIAMELTYNWDVEKVPTTQK